MRDDRRDTVQVAAMAAPFVVGLVVLVLLPAGFTVALAFTSYDLVSSPAWAGLGNFADLVDDDIFRTALLNSAVFAAMVRRYRAAYGL